MASSKAIVWLRRDLRLHDHPALVRATRDFDEVVALFVLDERLMATSPARTAFMLGCLRDLGPGLVVRRGRPEHEVPALAREIGADAVLYSADVSPFARRRDAVVGGAPCVGNHVVDPGAILTQAGRPYTVFSPFHRAWQQVPRRAVHRAVELERHRGLRSEDLPQGDGRPAFAAGEAAAREALAAWLAAGVDGYDGNGVTSRLSPYLRWGCLSPRECEERAARRGGRGAEAWVRQLAWRDFFAHVLLHGIGGKPNPSWEEPGELLAAWKEGRTGFPLVDAGMRELAATGWMHNRVRLVVGSFLTKDLHVDWREGERHFMEQLLDGEPSQNNGNWQWIASVGVDPAPVFRRIFNPTLQSQKLGFADAYIRRWVPELADLPPEALHDPPPLDREARGYPQPIVDHQAERRRALELYGERA